MKQKYDKCFISIEIDLSNDTNMTCSGYFIIHYWNTSNTVGGRS